MTDPLVFACNNPDCPICSDDEKSWEMFAAKVRELVPQDRFIADESI